MHGVVNSTLVDLDNTLGYGHAVKRKSNIV
jgi:hypothetical protein